MRGIYTRVAHTQTQAYNVKEPAFDTHRMPYTFRTKTLFLTYSQVSQDDATSFISPPTAHFEFIEQTLRTPEYYRLAQEHHADGGLHFHCIFGFTTPVHSSRTDILDFANTHPNIKSVRSGHGRTWDYCGKDGNIIHEFGEPQRLASTSGRISGEVWSQAVNATTPEEFYKTIRDASPRHFILYGRQLDEYVDKHFKRSRMDYCSPSFTTLQPERFDNWLNQSDLGRRGGERR